MRLHEKLKRIANAKLKAHIAAFAQAKPVGTLPGKLLYPTIAFQHRVFYFVAHVETYHHIADVVANARTNAHSQIAIQVSQFKLTVSVGGVGMVPHVAHIGKQHAVDVVT